MGEIEPLAYNVNDLGVVLNLSKQSIYNEINAGRLRSFKAHGRRLVSRVAVEEYIRAREAESVTTGAAA